MPSSNLPEWRQGNRRLHRCPRQQYLVRLLNNHQYAVNRLLNGIAETEQFFRAGIVAIDITEADPFTGDRTRHEDEIIGTKEKTDEYAY